MGEKVKVVDVTARDGLQNEPKPVSTRDKLALIEKLVQAGVSDIQATSFVHPKWVPQMADAEDVAAGLGKFAGVTFSALVPNLKGYDRALAAGIRHMEFVIAASETFNRKNLNRSMAESLQLLEQTTRLAERDGVVLRVGFSTCFHCPFEGRISSQAVLNAVRAAREIAPWRIAICDTDGMAFPDQVKETVGRLLGELKMTPRGSGRSIFTTRTAEAWPTRSRDSKQEFANLTLPPPAWAAARIAPAPAEILRRKISSIFWKAWATTRESIWRNCWMRPNLRAAFRPGPIKDISCARAVQAPAA